MQSGPCRGIAGSVKGNKKKASNNKAVTQGTKATRHATANTTKAFKVDVVVVTLEKAEAGTAAAIPSKVANKRDARVLTAIADAIPPNGANNKYQYKTVRIMIEPSSDRMSELMSVAAIRRKLADESANAQDSVVIGTTTSTAKKNQFLRTNLETRQVWRQTPRCAKMMWLPRLRALQQVLTGLSQID